MSETKDFDFAARLKELEEITNWFESEKVDLDQGLDKFERGVELIAALRKHLQGVENRVEQIKLKFEAQTPPPVDSSEPDLFN